MLYHRLFITFRVLALLVLFVATATPALTHATPPVPVTTASQPQDSRNTPPIVGGIDEWTVGGGFLYWAKCADIPALRPGTQPNVVAGSAGRIPLHGGFPTALTDQPLSPSCSTAHDLASDDSGLYYWDGTSIMKRLVGAPTTPQFVTTPEQAPLTLIVDSTYVFWIGATQIYRVGKDGSGQQGLMSTSGTARSLAQDDSSIYWTDDTGLHQVSKFCTRICKGYSLSTISGAGLIYDPYRNFTSQFRTFLYWSTGDTIQRYTCTLFLPSTCYTSTFYTAVPPQRIGVLATDGPSLFWVENSTVCDPFCEPSTAGVLYRMGIGDTDPQIIDGDIPNYGSKLLTDDQGVYLNLADGSSRASVGRVPFDATPVAFDSRVDNWEVTQGIQSLNNDVPMIAGKPTYVRVYGAETGPRLGNVEAVLRGQRNNVDLPGSPLAPLNGTRALVQGIGYDRAVLNDGWLFQLPDSWVTGGPIDLAAIVEPRRGYYDPDPTNNVRASQFNFVHKAPVCTVFIPVRTNAPATSTDDPNFWSMIDRFRTLWPVSNVWAYHQNDDIAEYEIHWGGPFDLVPYPAFGPYEIPEDNAKIIISLIERDIFSDDPDECDNNHARTHYVGMVHPDTDTGTNTGFANYVRAAAWVKLPPHDPNPPVDWMSPRAGSVMAQELSHNYNGITGNRWWHVNCGSPSDVTDDYPYNPCTLDDKSLTDPAVHYGFDPLSQTPIPPNTTGDYMSYAPQRWVSDYSFKGMFDELYSFPNLQGAPPAGAPQAAGLPPGVPDLTTANSVVLLTGVVTPTLGQGQLDYAWVVPTASLGHSMLHKWQALAAPRAPASASSSSAPAGIHTYHVRIIATNGTQIDDLSTTLNENDDDHAHSAAFQLTFPAPSTAVGRLDLMDGSRVIATLRPGTGTPTVKVTQPAGGERVGDSLTVKWKITGVDPQAALRYTIQYSPDLGHTWRALVTSLPAPPTGSPLAITFPHLSGIPGSTTGALVRVAVSDGWHTALATSAFTVTNRPPDAHIIAPAAGHPVPAGQQVLLRGIANDAEDGGLDGTALHWQIDGVAVGTGVDLHVAGLAPGKHDAALTVRDANGHEQTVHRVFMIAPLAVPQAAPPALDGGCDDAGYASAPAIQLAPYSDGSHPTVRLLRTDSDLWACFSGLQRGNGSPLASAVLRVDVDHSRDNVAQTTDYSFSVSEDGTPQTLAGDGNGGYTGAGSDGLQAKITAGTMTWNAELRIDATHLGGWNYLAGLYLSHTWVHAVSDDYQWPYNAVWNQPRSWATTVFGTPPTLTTVTPGSATAGDAALTLRLSGTNFAAGALVALDGVVRPSTVVSSTLITTDITAADLAIGRLVAITVTNPELAIAPSPAVTFRVNNPVPTLSKLQPASASFGRRSLTLTINGTHFVKGATVLWNGDAVPTTWISSTRLQATLGAAQLALPNPVPVVVDNPEPGGGASNAVTFTLTVVPQHTILLPLVRR